MTSMYAGNRLGSSTSSTVRPYIYINTKSHVQEGIHRSNAIELKGVFRFVLDFLFRKIFGKNFHRFGTQNAWFAAVHGDFICLVFIEFYFEKYEVTF